MKLAAFGSIDHYESDGHAASLATMVDLLAGYRTLVVDMSDDPGLLRKKLEVGDTVSGMDALVASFTSDLSLKESDIRHQIISMHPPASWGEWSKNSFDLLPGPRDLMPPHLDRLAAHRGERFADQLLEGLKDLNYELAVINLGGFINTLRGEVVLMNADLTIISMQTPTAIIDLQAARGRRYPRKPDSGIGTISTQAHSYPEPSFLKALVSKDKSFDESVPRFALDWADFLFPKIRPKLRDAAGRPIKAHQDLLSKILGW